MWPEMGCYYFSPHNSRGICPMSKVVMIVVATAALASAGGAFAQPDELAHDQAAKNQAEAAHQQAVKSGDKAVIARTAERIRTADEDIAKDKQEASWKVPPGAQGALRAADAELIQAKEENARAYASGDKAQIAAAGKRLHAAYQHQWAVAHAKK